MDIPFEIGEPLCKIMKQEYGGDGKYKPAAVEQGWILAGYIQWSKYTIHGHFVRDDGKEHTDNFSRFVRASAVSPEVVVV